MWTEKALRDAKGLGHAARKKITDYLEKRIESAEDPRRFGEALDYDLKGIWRYRVGDYRVFCQIRDQELTVLVVKADHRKDAYKKH